jgi:hypothetical protein
MADTTTALDRQMGAIARPVKPPHGTGRRPRVSRFIRSRDVDAIA